MPDIFGRPLKQEKCATLSNLESRFDQHLKIFCLPEELIVGPEPGTFVDLRLVHVAEDHSGKVPHRLNVRLLGLVGQDVADGGEASVAHFDVMSYWKLLSIKT